MELGDVLPLWSIVPFAGMLLSIALFPLFKAEWWEKHQLHVAAFWSLLFLVPFTAVFGFGVTYEQLLESVVVDYIPFIVLLLGLCGQQAGAEERKGKGSFLHMVLFMDD